MSWSQIVKNLVRIGSVEVVVHPRANKISGFWMPVPGSMNSTFHSLHSLHPSHPELEELDDFGTTKKVLMTALPVRALETPAEFAKFISEIQP